MTAKGKRNISLAGFLITFFGAIFFSTKAIIVKKAFYGTSVDALTLLTGRMIFSLPFYLGAAIFTSRRKSNIRMNKLQWIYVILLGIAGFYVSSYFDFAGLQYVPAGLERLILFLYPSFVVLINLALFKQKISNIQKLALALTYAGIGIAYFGELKIDTVSHDFYRGSFLIFICAITYSFYIVGSGRMIPILGAAKFTAYAMLAATAGVFIHFLLKYRSTNHLFSPSLVGYAVLLALIATVIPSFMLSYGMKKIGANNAAIISCIGPVSTILQAHFILGDKIFVEQVTGAILVIIGVLLIGWKSMERSEI